MLKYIYFLSAFFILVSCQENSVNSIKVSNKEELNKALENVNPGDEIILSNGIWKDVEIKFRGKGEKDKPIVLRAENDGSVFIEGKSHIKIGGEYLVVKGLYFRNGYTTSNSVIDFKITKEEVATNCKVTNCVIDGYNPLSRDTKDHWVEFWGRYNELSNCYLAGKTNEGPTVRVEIKGNRNIKNYHKIVNNHFGPRPRKGGPKGETIQLGDSFSSMSPSNTLVANNLFEECNGEVEIISSKTNFNEFRNNVFYKSEGSLVTRHGNYCTIDGNFFIGDDKNENVGGIRLINTGHSVTNNYFYNLKGKNFRSPLAVMNGIPKSPLNRYNQVTDVVVAYNTYVNCKSPWQFGVGTNISQKDVLPLSEIRSARPIRTVVANNVIYNEIGDESPIVEHDKADGVSFKSNVINNQGVGFMKKGGLLESKFELSKISESIFIPQDLSSTEPYNGFDFDKIDKDLFGNSRKNNNSIGSSVNTEISDPFILDKKKYGTDWYSNEKQVVEPKIHLISENDDIQQTILDASNGDIIKLKEGVYNVSQSLIINKNITIQSEQANKVTIEYTGKENTPLYELQSLGKLNLKDVTLRGGDKQFAFASLKEDMFNHFGLNVENCTISNFNYVLKVYKQSYSEEISFVNSSISNCENGIELSEEKNDKGDYNTEYLIIDNCKFNNVKTNVVDYYRGGYDESTIGGNLLLTNSEFTNCGKKESNGILINNRGIVNVTIENNTFKNNPVKLVAVLWGAKNNHHANNQIVKSGEIRVVENLKLKLMY